MSQPASHTAPFVPHLTSGRSRAAFLGSFWSLIHALLPSLSATAVFFVSATFLSPVDFGHLAMATALVSVALAFSPAAFGEALVQRETLKPEHANAVFWLNAGFALVYCGALVLLAPVFAAYFDVPELRWILPILALKIPFELLAAVPASMIIRKMRFRLLALRTAIGSAVGMVLSVGLLLAGHGLLALVVAQVAVSVTTFVVVLWTAGWRPGVAMRLCDLRALAHYGVFAAGQRMLGMVRLDHLVLGTIGGPVLLGLLVFSQRVFQLLASVAGGALSSVTHVVLSSMQGEPEKARRAFGLVSFVAAGVGFPAFAGAALIIDDLVAMFFAENWLDAARAAQLFCLVGFLFSLGIVQGALIRSRGYPNWLFYYQLVQEAGTVLVIALVYPWGIEAVVAAIAVKTALIWPISVAMTVRLLDCSVWTYIRSFAAPACATLGMVVVLLSLPQGAGIQNLALQIVVGACVYGLLILTLCWSRLTEVRRLILTKPERAI